MIKEEERKHCVYKLTSPNGKIYIGRTSQNPPEKAWKKGYLMNHRLNNDIFDYKLENFTKEILVSNLTQDEAKILKVFYIIKFNSEFPNYNKTLYTYDNELKKTIEGILRYD